MPTLTRQAEPVITMSQERAESLAKHLNIEAAFDADGWTYKAEPYAGNFTVVVFDEEGNRLGHIN